MKDSNKTVTQSDGTHQKMDGVLELTPDMEIVSATQAKIIDLTEVLQPVSDSPDGISASSADPLSPPVVALTDPLGAHKKSVHLNKKDGTGAASKPKKTIVPNSWEDILARKTLEPSKAPETVTEDLDTSEAGAPLALTDTVQPVDLAQEEAVSDEAAKPDLPRTASQPSKEEQGEIESDEAQLDAPLEDDFLLLEDEVKPIDLLPEEARDDAHVETPFSDIPSSESSDTIELTDAVQPIDLVQEKTGLPHTATQPPEMEDEEDALELTDAVKPVDLLQEATIPGAGDLSTLEPDMAMSDTEEVLELTNAVQPIDLTENADDEEAPFPEKAAARAEADETDLLDDALTAAMDDILGADETMAEIDGVLAQVQDAASDEGQMLVHTDQEQLDIVDSSPSALKDDDTLMLTDMVTPSGSDTGQEIADEQPETSFPEKTAAQAEADETDLLDDALTAAMDDILGADETMAEIDGVLAQTQDAASDDEQMPAHTDQEQLDIVDDSPSALKDDDTLMLTDMATPSDSDTGQEIADEQPEASIPEETTAQDEPDETDLLDDALTAAMDDVLGADETMAEIDGVLAQTQDAASDDEQMPVHTDQEQLDVADDSPSWDALKDDDTLMLTDMVTPSDSDTGQEIADEQPEASIPEETTAQDEPDKTDLPADELTAAMDDVLGADETMAEIDGVLAQTQDAASDDEQMPAHADQAQPDAADDSPSWDALKDDDTLMLTDMVMPSDSDTGQEIADEQPEASIPEETTAQDEPDETDLLDDALTAAMDDVLGADETMAEIDGVLAQTQDAASDDEQTPVHADQEQPDVADDSPSWDALKDDDTLMLDDMVMPSDMDTEQPEASIPEEKTAQEETGKTDLLDDALTVAMDDVLGADETMAEIDGVLAQTQDAASDDEQTPVHADQEQPDVADDSPSWDALKDDDTLMLDDMVMPSDMDTEQPEASFPEKTTANEELDANDLSDDEMAALMDDVLDEDDTMAELDDVPPETADLMEADESDLLDDEMTALMDDVLDVDDTMAELDEVLEDTQDAAFDDEKIFDHTDQEQPDIVDDSPPLDTLKDDAPLMPADMVMPSDMDTEQPEASFPQETTANEELDANDLSDDEMAALMDDILDEDDTTAELDEVLEDTQGAASDDEQMLAHTDQEQPDVAVDSPSWDALKDDDTLMLDDMVMPSDMDTEQPEASFPQEAIEPEAADETDLSDDEMAALMEDVLDEDDTIAEMDEVLSETADLMETDEADLTDDEMMALMDDFLEENDAMAELGKAPMEATEPAADEEDVMDLTDIVMPETQEAFAHETPFSDRSGQEEDVIPLSDIVDAEAVTAEMQKRQMVETQDIDEDIIVLTDIVTSDEQAAGEAIDEGVIELNDIIDSEKTAPKSEDAPVAPTAERQAEDQVIRLDSVLEHVRKNRQKIVEDIALGLEGNLSSDPYDTLSEAPQINFNIDLSEVKAAIGEIKDLNDKELERVIEEIIRTKYAETIEKAIARAVEKAVTREMEGIKRNLIDDLDPEQDD